MKLKFPNAKSIIRLNSVCMAGNTNGDLSEIINLRYAVGVVAAAAQGISCVAKVDFSVPLSRWQIKRD